MTSPASMGRVVVARSRHLPIPRQRWAHCPLTNDVISSYFPAASYIRAQHLRNYACFHPMHEIR